MLCQDQFMMLRGCCCRCAVHFVDNYCRCSAQLASGYVVHNWLMQPVLPVLRVLSADHGPAEGGVWRRRRPAGAHTDRQRQRGAQRGAAGCIPGDGGAQGGVAVWLLSQKFNCGADVHNVVPMLSSSQSVLNLHEVVKVTLSACTWKRWCTGRRELSSC